jgi:hypothetical protein
MTESRQLKNKNISLFEAIPPVDGMIYNAAGAIEYSPRIGWMIHLDAFSKTATEEKALTFFEVMKEFVQKEDQ